MGLTVEAFCVWVLDLFVINLELAKRRVLLMFFKHINKKNIERYNILQVFYRFAEWKKKQTCFLASFLENPDTSPFSLYKDEYVWLW